MNAPQTTPLVYIHGIGAQHAPENLKHDWDTALLRRDVGQLSRFAYWADILRPLRTARALKASFGVQESIGPGIPPQAPIEDLAPDSGPARDFARKLFDRIASSAVAEEGLEPSAAIALGQPHLARVVPGEWLRRPITWAITRLFIHDVAAYFYEPGIRDQIDARLEAVLVAVSAPCLLVSHSLGTVISYQVLHRLGDRTVIPVWLTLGSPLGIAEVQDHIQRPLRVPPGVGRWCNFADRLDPVALDAELANDFTPGDRIGDRYIKNPYRLDLTAGGPHAALGYLADEVVHAALAANNP
jgi:hypothetical protein